MAPATLRTRMETAVERLLAALDAMDGDADLELACEDEGGACEDEGGQCDDEGHIESHTVSAPEYHQLVALGST